MLFIVYVPLTTSVRDLRVAVDIRTLVELKENGVMSLGVGGNITTTAPAPWAAYAAAVTSAAAAAASAPPTRANSVTATAAAGAAVAAKVGLS